MAGKIKKGFSSYLIVLVIAIIAALLVCVTIMLFSPFKPILGFKYFFYEDENYEYNVSDGLESEFFNFSTISQINVNCNFSNVAVMRDAKVEHDCIQIVNKAKGFAKDTQNTAFTYDISYGNTQKTIINIEVNEPEGFLYFSKEININILLPITSTYALQNTKIDITNTSGDVYIGNGVDVTTEGSNEIDINSLSIKNNSGKILIFSLAEPNFENLFISSKGGDVEFRESISVSQSLNIFSKTAKFKFKSIDFKNEESKIKLDLANAKFACDDIKGDVDLVMKSGYFDAQNITGDISSNNENAQMNSATITINKVSGAVSFPFLNATRVNISSIVNGELYAHSTKGDINIDNAESKVYIETSSGNVNLNTKASDLEIKTKTGDINVIYNSTTISDQLDFYTKRGTINLNVKSSLAFILAVYDSEGQLKEKGISVEGIGDDVANPLKINNGKKYIKMFSDAKVNISLI